MLLRRFSKHCSDQNWFAVGLDVVVVVLGIFLGIHSAKKIFADPKLINLSILMLGITRSETRFLNDLMPVYDGILESIAAELHNRDTNSNPKDQGK